MNCSEAINYRPPDGTSPWYSPAQRYPNTDFHHPNKDNSFIVPYTVPDFGMDRDIKSTLDHIKVAEKSTGKKWKLA